MPGTPTTKWSLPTINGGVDIIDDAPINDLAVAIDPLLTPTTSGTYASRPTSTGGTPGKVGRTYWATDVKVLYRDNGTGWDVIGFAPIAARVTNSVALGPVASGNTWTWDTERYDVGGVHAASSNQFQVPVAGIYRVGIRVALTGAGGTYRRLELRDASAVIARDHRILGADPAVDLSCETDWPLAAGDVVAPVLVHDGAAGAVTIAKSTDAVPEFFIHRVAPHPSHL